MDTPSKIVQGVYDIIVTPDLLITDYIAVGGLGASFVNSGLLMLLSTLLLYCMKVNINGISIAALFLMSGFALFGKNLLNVWFIIFGVYIYAKFQKDKFSKYIYIAFFATSMSPMISDMMFASNQPFWVRFLLSIVIGIIIGFLVPPLSAHLVKFHQGFNLYNIGFTTGMVGTIFVSLLKSYGYETKSNLIWSTGNNVILGIFLVVIFLSIIITGIILSMKIETQGISTKEAWKLTVDRVRKIWTYSGRLVSDFTIMEGFGPTLINMGLNGFIGMAYVLLVGGDLNGPTIGGILAMVGFGAFGKHMKNMIPIFLGVIIGSLTNVWDIHSPSILLVALFGTSLAPISGQFGWKYGIIAGFINSSVALSVSALHGALNLYNTGFSAGIVAAVLVPIIEAFRKDDID